jgi:hypothetical protein
MALAVGFRLQGGRIPASTGGVTRNRVRVGLWIGLLVSAVFAAWTWLRPYDWQSDPRALGRVAGVEVRRDHSFYWLDVRVKMKAGEQHDLTRPVTLETGARAKVEPADTTMTGDSGQPITEIWFRFWLEEADFAGPLNLHLNQGSLRVRKGSGTPALGSSGRKYFTTSHW